MNIVLIVGNYYPKPSSVANCVSQLLNILKAHEHTVILITNSSDCIHPYSAKVDKTEILFIPDRFGYYSLRINKIFKAMNEFPLGKYLKKMMKMPIYLRYYLFAKEAGMIGWYTHKNAQDCWRMIQSKHIDLIISFSHPFSTHFFSSYLYEKLDRKIPWVIYEFDPYAYNDVSSPTKALFKRHRKQEQELFIKASKIIVTPELFDYYSHTTYKAHIGKMHPLPYTLLHVKDSEEKENISGDHVCRMVYAGSFYADIRNPSYAINVIGYTGNGCVLLLVTNYEEPAFIQTINSFPGKFKKQNMVDQDSVLSLMKEADILVSVGNTVEIQVPAKIFEYMGLGKPIIHFSKMPKDPSLKYLARYPMALIINEFEANPVGHARQIESFLKRMKGKQMTYEEVRKCLPELDKKNVADTFIKIVELRNENLKEATQL